MEPSRAIIAAEGYERSALLQLRASEMTDSDLPDTEQGDQRREKRESLRQVLARHRELET